MKLVMTLLVRDEADIIRQNIEHHFSQGVDFVVATDNGSIDGTREILAEYERAGYLKIIDDPEQDFSLHIWVTRMAKMAGVEFGADWVLSNDADEFWVSPNGQLKSELQNSDAPELSCQRINMLCAYDDTRDLHPFQKLVYRIKTPIPIPTSQDFVNDLINNPYLYFDLPAKVLVQSKGLIRIRQGNHSAEFEQEKWTEHSSIKIYHSPFRSKEQFHKKILQGGKAYTDNTRLSKNLGWHWRRWYKFINDDKFEDALAELLPSADRLQNDFLNGDIVKDFTLQEILTGT